MKLGKREEATADYEELITFDPKDNSDILVNKGYAYLRLEKFEDAHKYFDEATKMNQKCVSGFCGKATVYLRTGQEYQALKYYNKVLSLNPDFREHVIDHGKVQVIVQSIQDRILEKEKRTIQEFTLASQSTPKDERHNANNGTQPQAKKMQFLIEYNHSKKRLDLEVYSIEQLIAEVSRLINLTSPILLEYWDDDFSEWIDLDDIRYITKMEKAKLKVKPVFGQLAENRNLYIKDISVGNLLGSGSYGEVYKGIWNGTTRVALKKLHQPYDFKTFASEVQVLMQLRHPNIVWFFGLYHSQSGEYFIVTEFLDSGNLRDFLLDKKDLDFSILMHMAANACAGMVYLSSHGVVHRDLSARNLLVKHEDGHYVVKVADFGLSRVVDADYYVANKKSRFPLKWTAVEAIKYGKYSSKSDVWSFGVSLWEILEYGAEPYFGLDTQEVKEYIIKGNRLSCPPNCPENLYQLMLKCWNEDPAQRPSFKELFEHIRVYCEYTDLVEKKVPDDETENHTEEDLHSARWTYI